VTSGDLAHLDPSARVALGLPLDERIAFARGLHYVPYTRAQQTLQLLGDLLEHPKTLRMPNLLLVGASGNGKTTVLDRFRSMYPVSTRPGGEALAPVILMQMPSEPSETRFWTELLLALHIAHRDTDPVQRKKNQAMSVLAYVGCRMLVIDEFHNVLHGHARQQRHFLAVLKNLGNELRLPIVVAGTRDAVRTLHTDTQLSSRFEAFGLPRWKLDREFLRLLASFERFLPLEAASNLAGREMAIRLHSMSEGVIGRLAMTLTRAAVQAIRDGKPQIDRGCLDAFEPVKASDYNRLADAL